MKWKINNIWMVMIILMLVMTGCGENKEKSKKVPELAENNDSKVEETEKMEDAVTASDQKDTDDKTSDEKDKKGETKEDRTLAPNFTLDDGKGNEYSLADYKGKLVLVNFFTTWCKYCVEEMPHFNKIYDKYRLEDVAILGVNVQTDPSEMPKEDVLDWIAEKKVTFPIVFDDEGQATDNYYINAYPTTYVIDKEGYIVGYVNAVDEEMLEKIIDMYR